MGDLQYVNLWIAGVATTAPLVAVGLLVARNRWRSLSGWQRLVVCLLSASALFAGSIVGEALAGYPGKRAWDVLQYLPGLFIPSAWLHVLLTYGATVRPGRARNVALLCVPPLLVAALCATNGSHHLMWSEPGPGEAFGEIPKVPGPGMVAVFCYFIACCTAGIVALIRRSYWSAVAPRGHTVGLLASLALFPATLVTSLVPGARLQGMDLSQYAMVVGLWHVCWFLWSRERPSTLAALSRDALLRYMDDAVIVVGRDGAVIDANPAAVRLLGRASGPLIHTPVSEVLPTVAAVGRPLEEGRVTVATTSEAGESVCEANVSNVLGWDGSFAAQVLVLRDVTERHRMEQALRQSEQSYREVLSATSEAIFVHDPRTGVIVDANEAAERMYGLSRDELLGLAVSHLSAAGKGWTHERAMAAMRAAEGGQEQLLEWLARRSSGGEFWAEVSLRSTAIGGNERVLAVVRDVSARKAAEEAERERILLASRRQRALADLAADPSAGRGDVTASARVATASVAEVTGASRVSVWLLTADGGSLVAVDVLDSGSGTHAAGEELPTRELPAYLTALSASRAVEASEARSDPRTAELRAPYLDPGAISSLLASPIRLRGQVAGSVCVEYVRPGRSWAPEDVDFASAVADQLAQVLANHRLRRTNEALMASEREKAAILDSIPDHVLYMDADCRVVWANRAVADSLGVAPETIAGSPCPLRDSPQCDMCPVTRALERGEMQSGEAVTEGGEVWAIRAYPVRDASSAIAGIVRVSRDLTEQRRAEADRRRREEQAQRGQRLESIGVLAGGIAHDFNNILATMMGFGELAYLDAAEGSDDHRRLEQVLQAGRRARDLISQILMFSRQHESQPVCVSLQPIVKESLKFLRASLPSTLEFREEIDSECGEVVIDPTQFHQVVMNLCTNAGHAMGSSGTLDVRLSEVDVDEGLARQLAVPRPGRYARLTVSDTGVGMDQATQDRIFEPFFSTKPEGEGTGLGLSTAHGIVSAHGGGITVYSELGVGSTFHVYLPRAQGEGEVAEAVDEAAPLGSERILVVDDEPAVTAMAAETLRVLGYRVDEYTDSRDALRAFRDAPEAYDLVLTDHTMPHFTGTQLLASMRFLRPELPVVIATGLQPRAVRALADIGNAATVLTKPYSVAELAQAIRDALDH